MGIRIALAGNPNCGKTTMFNALTGANQYVGNWPGVTVEKKEGRLKDRKRGEEVIVTDLPGIYSLSPYTLEEVVSRDYLLNENPDVIVDLVDATNIERNLYLTTQLIETGIPVVIALNMSDLIGKRGLKIDSKRLSMVLGCPVVETSALKKTGLGELIDEAVKVAHSREVPLPKDIFSDDVEAAVSKVADLLTVSAPRRRWYAVKVLENDEKVVSGAKLTVSDRIDRVVTNRILGIPIFIAVMFIVYYISVTTVGTWVTDWTNDTFGGWVADLFTGMLGAIGAGEVVTSLVVDGIVGGLVAVLGFVPQMAILFLFLSILEDCGYMVRIAFVMDRVFRHFGFIPLLISSGCGIPGIMASRTIEQDNDRRLTIMTATFIPCGAKLPVISLMAGVIAGAAMGYAESAWVAPAMYFLGIVAVLVSAIILKKTRPFSGKPAPFVMELPAYHVPSVRTVLMHVWERLKGFIIKAGTILFLACVVMWFLGGFGFGPDGFGMVDSDDSLLATIGGFIAPLFAPLGFGQWQPVAASLSGFTAKEAIVSTMGVLASVAGDVEDAGVVAPAVAQWFTFNGVPSALAAFCFLMFNMGLSVSGRHRDDGPAAAEPQMVLVRNRLPERVRIRHDDDRVPDRQAGRIRIVRNRDGRGGGVPGGHSLHALPSRSLQGPQELQQEKRGRGKNADNDVHGAGPAPAVMMPREERYVCRHGRRRDCHRPGGPGRTQAGQGPQGRQMHRLFPGRALLRVLHALRGVDR